VLSRRNAGVAQGINGGQVDAITAVIAIRDACGVRAAGAAVGVGAQFLEPSALRGTSEGCV